MTSPQSFLPSPTVSAFHLGPLTIHFYALCIIAGIGVAIWLGSRRWIARGGRPGQVADICLWAIPGGILGGRLYHVITDPELYFLPGRNPWNAFAIWDGGLGIWGAIALGCVGAWIGCRRAGVSLIAFLDAVAPGVIFAQALGRWGNWFNNELYGDPTALPWKLQIHQMDQGAGTALTDASGHAVILGYYQPTFLYESLWCVVVGLALLALDRRYKLGAGSVFAFYAAGYTAGRFVLELMRSDYANLILGLRVNTWVAGLVCLAAVIAFLILRTRPRSTAFPATANPTGAPELNGTPKVGLGK
ncbi:prolipoprotein diacylglyceryl transferase [Arthrobacter livingstonensis]|uniref:Phosphatidylglycerol--prolipoprotein diacylglyceryl transferase n=1 Tax=Arthrobacter livingstonensis TaxID=670078 RepID=A0A2V5LE65_9MICC|nr:prolipoprotein diacylglyceryl transferase [Arthrobacter livingstonensis]PYI69808.1 prolipoprotein diacylglyceryl transferase [Arthrobacter livingstonensis]